MQFPRVLDFDSGIAMVVTDLHGEGDVYDHLCKKFFDAYAKGEVDRLIICGDLIHGRGDNPDHSLRMVLNMMQLQSEMGSDKIVLLMGNHEMPHIYNITLSRGYEEYTAPFERMLTQTGKRDEVYAFFRSLPFYVRTKAGVLLTHAGATTAVKTVEDTERLFTFDHEALIYLADDIMRRNVDIDALKGDKNYVRQAMKYLALTGLDDPRFSHLLRGQIVSQTQEEFNFLWDVLFARNEQDSSIETYTFIAEKFLEAVSASSEFEQRVLVAGHIAVRGGHKLVGERQLRLASYAHANPYEAGEYLLLDCAVPIHAATDLLPHLRQTLS